MTAPESQPWSDVPVQPGEVLADKYRVDKILGVGGMGVVVAATHLQLDQKVALKFMLPAGVKNQSLVERFSREARAAVKLKSDHVARVLDVGTLPWGAPYMVMEFLEGLDLGAVIEQSGPMTVERAVDCVLQACDAVAEAHSLGIVHRDLKPRNLFLTRRNDGRELVKVLDFGISKHKADGDMSLTATTEVIGSPFYMSPEQLKSAKLADERSDVWALGVILYELMVGKVPFLAESVTALTAMVLTEAPAAANLARADIPAGLSAVIGKCLEKDPVNRYPNVASLAAALEPFAPADTRDLAARISRIGGGSMIPAAPSLARVVATGSTKVGWAEPTTLAGEAKPRGRGPWIAALVGVAVLCTAAGVLLASRGRGDDAKVPPLPPPVPAGTTLASGTLPPPVALADPAPSVSAAAPSAVASGSAAVPNGVVPPPPWPGRPGTKTTPSATGSSTTDPPRYRTSW